ncbi:RDD family protein [Salimicrobium halophilum]|uniref:RDD family protein n=1 Tax=Salimicrobium halophilum TaxID=86666 RepID=A0A1G8UX68_9BACI|nr:RDD family protein [Salimicrobium halophilum]SDJ58398.1 RDD family protein [Salimicrobium halophilum]
MKNAGAGRRILAFGFDYLLILLYGIGVVGSVAVLFREPFTSLFTHSPLVAQASGFVVITLPVFLYFSISEGSRHQGTWGKRRLRLLVTDNTGEKLTLGKALLRSGLKFLPWELAHFFIWHAALPSSLPSGVVVAGLVGANLLLVIYVAFPFFEKNSRNVYDLRVSTFVYTKG